MRNDTTAYYFADDLPDAGIQFRCLTDAAQDRLRYGEVGSGKWEDRKEQGARVDEAQAVH